MPDIVAMLRTERERIMVGTDPCPECCEPMRCVEEDGYYPRMVCPSCGFEENPEEWDEEDE